jgi:hypothetical protein
VFFALHLRCILFRAGLLTKACPAKNLQLLKAVPLTRLAFLNLSMFSHAVYFLPPVYVLSPYLCFLTLSTFYHPSSFSRLVYVFSHCMRFTTPLAFLNLSMFSHTVYFIPPVYVLSLYL